MAGAKLKSNSGAAKRFKKTGSGGYKHRCKDRNHILTKKSTKRKRRLRKNKAVNKADHLAVTRLLRGS